MPPGPTDRKLEVFAACPLFRNLPPSQQSALAQLAVEMHFDKGQVLFLEGDRCEGLFVIGSGTVKLVKTSASGREIMLAIEGSPSTIAEIPVFDGGPYPATAIALEDTTVYQLPKDRLRRFCLEHPQVSLEILRFVGKRLRHLVSLIHEITFGTVRQRLARVLLEWRDEFGADEFSLPATHEELALRLGTVREVISRNLSRFQAEGFIRIDRRKVTIVDAEALRNEAETPY